MSAEKIIDLVLVFLFCAPMVILLVVMPLVDLFLDGDI